MSEPANKLTITPKGEREFVVTRMFKAPRPMVWDAHTKPELVRRWLLGPPGWTMPVCEIDLRVGGRYRYEWANADGRIMGMGGVYREVAAPARLVANELFDEDWTGGETTVTQDFTEHQGGTLLTLTVLYTSTAARDGAAKTGMNEGLETGYQRLDALLAE